MTRLFVGAGRSLGIRPGDIVGAIANEAGIPAREIGAIEIAERFTLVEVASSRAGEVIDALRETTLKGRPVTVRLDRGARKSADAGRRSRFDEDGDGRPGEDF